MTRGTLMVLVATAMAMLLAGCGSSQKEDQGSSHGGSQREVGSSQQTSEPTTDVTLVGRCADNASAVGPQEEASGGEVSNGKIAFLRYPARASANKDIYVIDEEGTHETRLTHTTQLVELNPLWSPDGKKIAFTSGNLGGLYVMNADGTNQTQLAEYADYLPFAWSPDGKKIAFKERGSLYVINADRTNKARLATPFSRNSEYRTVLGTPVWSPDGKKIAFASRSSRNTGSDSTSTAEPASVPVERFNGIYLINVDGTGLCRLTRSTYSTVAPRGGPVWSPDGKKIAFYDGEAINVINTDGSGREELAQGGRPTVTSATWSPDGRKIAFVHHSGSIYVMNADGSGRRRLTNTPGSRFVELPTWSPDSEKIAFIRTTVSREDIAGHSELCVVDADGPGSKCIATVAHPTSEELALSWGRR